MKKQITIFLIIVQIIFIPIKISAVEGTCSWHNGVNCNIGPDWDGSTICNDGWRDSTEQFYFAKECNYNNNDYCWFTKGYLIDEYNKIVNQYNFTKTKGIIDEEKLRANNLYKEIQLKEIEYLENYEKISDQTITMTHIRRQQTKLTEDYQLEVAFMNADYNMLIANINSLIDTYNLELKFFNEECSRLGYNGLIEHNNKAYEETLKESKKCEEGYIKIDNKCISYSDNCKKSYGNYVYGDENYCYCINGYEWNNDKTECIKKQTICLDLINGYLGDDGICYCNIGFSWNDIEQKCAQAKTNFKSNEKLSKEIIKEEKEAITKVDKNLSKRMSGNILLQVEKNGEGWYVYPDNKKKYYLGRPADAFSIMRKLGLGATHEFITSHTIYPDNVLGKILLDVEQNGEAYYIYPKDKKAYYLGRPSDAFSVMRNLGLGITNDNVRKIDIGEIK